MDTDRRGRLEAFMEAYAQTLGGLAERDAEGDLQLLDPVSETLRLLVFEPEGLTERPGAELVAPGSAAPEEFLTQARSRGRRIRRWNELQAVGFARAGYLWRRAGRN